MSSVTITAERMWIIDRAIKRKFPFNNWGFQWQYPKDYDKRGVRKVFSLWIENMPGQTVVIFLTIFGKRIIERYIDYGK